MDKLDLKILEILDWSGRTPVNRIAKLVGSNKDVVAYRMKKLERENIIKNYYPVLDPYRLGYNISRIYLDVEEMSKEKETDFIEYLDKEINSELIFGMDYPYKYGLFLWTKSIYEVHEKIVKIKRKLGKLLIRYNHSIVTFLGQYPKDYLFGKRHHQKSVVISPEKMIAYDEKDFKILAMLAKNARISTMQIADSLKIPQTTVSTKIKHLEKKKIICGYRAEIDFTKLGYTNYFLEIYLDENENLSKIYEWASHHRHVVWLQEIIGTCDIEIEVEVEDRNKLEGILNELRSKFKNIRKIIFWSQDYKKLTYLPKNSEVSKFKLIS